MDYLLYGNEGSRQKGRVWLPQMDDSVMMGFIHEIARVLKPSGHLLLWVDKFHPCRGISPWIERTDLRIVDMIVWDRMKMDMGHRTGRRSEYLLILQKSPTRAKGLWRRRDIPDVWQEKVDGKLRRKHPHAKLPGLMGALIEVLTDQDDLVVDSAAGSFMVPDVCREAGRTVLGTDPVPPVEKG